jgi:hypothetical protein
MISARAQCRFTNQLLGRLLHVRRHTNCKHASLMEEQDKPDDPGTPAHLPRVSPGEPNRATFIVRPWEPERVGLYAFAKAPRQNEQGNVEVCQRLVDHLKSQGIDWGRATKREGPENGVDCVCHSSEGAIWIQVSRALRDQEYFGTLSRHKAVRADTTNQELAQGLWNSIEHKAKRTSEADRRSIVLVLDASEVFMSKDSDALKLFETRFGDKAKVFAFRAIWLVGSHRLLVTQLA